MIQAASILFRPASCRDDWVWPAWFTLENSNFYAIDVYRFS